MVYLVGDALRLQGMPFISVASYDAQAIPPAYANVTWSEKPVELTSLPLRPRR